MKKSRHSWNLGRKPEAPSSSAVSRAWWTRDRRSGAVSLRWNSRGKTATAPPLTWPSPSTRSMLFRMPILGDALEEAGVTNHAILGRCRQQGMVHVRGGWLLDLLLGKA